MNGIILPYGGKDIGFELASVDVKIPAQLIFVRFNMYDGEILTPVVYDVVIKDNLNINYNDISEYYRRLCIDLGIDPSIVPDGMVLTL